MDKNKKIILITVISIIAIILIGTLIYFLFIKDDNTNNIARNSKLEKINEKINQSGKYSISIEGDKNKIYYSKKDNMAYTDSEYEGQNTEFLVKDGNTYLIQDDTKRYFTYTNNEIDLTKYSSVFEELSTKDFVKGKEKIDNTEYIYQEYQGITNFAIENLEEDLNEEEVQNIKTRFYFKGDDLVYIKTIAGEKEELLKISISYKVDDNLFSIPEGYTEG